MEDRDNILIDSSMNLTAGFVEAIHEVITVSAEDTADKLAEIKNGEPALIDEGTHQLK